MSLDAIIIGSGPNGLVAAATLARAGLDVLVLEAKERPGGAVGSAPLTEPGFVHDLGAGFFPFGPVSPALASLDLPGAGLVWRHAPVDSAHPAADGSCGIIARDLARTRRTLGKDGEAWGDWVHFHDRLGDRFIRAMLAPLPALGPALALGPAALVRLLRIALTSPAEFAEVTFRTEAARRIIPGLALHVDIGPDDLGGTMVGLVLGLLAARAGFGVPEGGAGAITRALVRRVEEARGALRTSTRVARVLVRGGVAVGVRTAAGEEIEARTVVADTGAPALCLKLVGEDHLPGHLVRAMQTFEHGWGTFKVDWALDGPVPWAAADCRQAAVVHVGESVAGLRAFTNQVREGKLPESPYLLVGQQSIADPTRAPPGKHTLYAYTHVPSSIAGGWNRGREIMADRMEAWIEALAPGFRRLVRARRIHAPPDLEAMDENLVGGDLGGGTAHLGRQLFFRPAFPYFRYRMPVKGLYLASSYTHPGAGVHGACGYNAAQAVLKDVE